MVKNINLKNTECSLWSHLQGSQEKQKLKESSMDSREIILDFEIINHYWLDSGEHDLDYGWEIIDTWEYGDHR